MIEISVNKHLQAASGKMLLDVHLEIEKGKLVTLYGKSGAGKTSLLKIIAGLLPADHGKIIVEDIAWLDSQKKIDLPPQKRNIGFVFQEYALFPNMTVKENLLFAWSKGQDKKIISELIEIIDLGDLQNRKPQTLSGGQKQRVALARALVKKPQILMLDEPLSALDHEMRHKLQQYVIEVHKAYELTTILISHDVSEIIKMSDYLLEIDHGKIINKGVPTEVFTQNKGFAKFQLTGEVINIVKQDFIYIITVLIGKDLVKVVADDHEAKTLA
ncbi:MAG: ATP-binding cassette domain-containing protein, partial [Flavobacteriaceae bacterium]|nr:ATP-binding cassette domain-containing protein [Flavobacteriaceae bacterium]